MSTYFLTSALSEFRINADGSIDRMSVLSTRYLAFAPAGSRIDELTVGNPCYGITPDGRHFCTSEVRVIQLDPRQAAFAEIRALAEQL